MIKAFLEYAKALYELAAEEGAEETVLNEMGEIVGVLNENPQYLDLLDAPNIPALERVELVSGAFSGINTNLLNFIRILVTNKQMKSFESCHKEYIKLYNTAHNREEVTVITAFLLSHEQKAALVKKLEKLLGKTIVPVYKVDKKCLGGVILRFADRQIDGSIKGKLDALGQSIVSTIA